MTSESNSELPDPGGAGAKNLLVNFFVILYEIRSVRD